MRFSNERTGEIHSYSEVSLLLKPEKPRLSDPRVISALSQCQVYAINMLLALAKCPGVFF